MSIPASNSGSYDKNPLDELPDIPEMKSLDPKDKDTLDEWWRQVRVVLDRWRDEEVIT